MRSRAIGRLAVAHVSPPQRSATAPSTRLGGVRRFQPHLLGPRKGIVLHHLLKVVVGREKPEATGGREKLTAEEPGTTGCKNQGDDGQPRPNHSADKRAHGHGPFPVFTSVGVVPPRARSSDYCGDGPQTNLRAITVEDFPVSSNPGPSALCPATFAEALHNPPESTRGCTIPARTRPCAERRHDAALAASPVET